MNSFKEQFKIAKVLASLFTHSATPEEEEAYRDWLNQHPENQKIADRILSRERYERNHRVMKSFSSQQAWEKIVPLLGEEKSPNRFSWKTSLMYAALILLLVIPASYLIYKGAAEEPISEFAPGTKGAEVVLSNGSTFKFPEGALPEGAPIAFVIDSAGINYHIPNNKPQVEEQKNVLRTLQGMECQITLSDGSKVHLNAESQLTYPVCFGSKERIVQVEGEAYFEIAPDKEHPFIVQTPHSSIRVTGTAFNVRAYADEKTECITLISGGITISHDNEVHDMVPNQHYIYSKAARTCTIAEVNPEFYTSWKSGAFLFRNVPLEEVMSYLAKWYGCHYTFTDEAAKKKEVGGYLNRYKNMNEIIDVIMDLNKVEIKQRDGVLFISNKQ